VRGGWSAASRRLVRLFALAFDRASAQGALSSARVRTTARGVSKAVAEALSRPTGAMSGVVGLALLVVACSLLLFRSERRSRPAAVTADSASNAAVVSPAVLPVTPTPAVPATPSAPPRDPVTLPALPVLTPEKLPRSPVAAVQSTSSKTRKARRRGKRHSPPASSSRSAATLPSTPMSSAMMRLSEVLAKGRNRQPAPATDAASVQARDRASPKTE